MMKRFLPWVDHNAPHFRCATCYLNQCQQKKRGIVIKIHMCGMHVDRCIGVYVKEKRGDRILERRDRSRRRGNAWGRATAL